MDILEKIFGSISKVKLIRLFLFNPRTAFTLETIALRIQSKPSSARREIKNLETIGLIKKKTQKIFKSKTKRRGKQIVWVLNEEFPFIGQLEGLLVNTVKLLHGDLLKKISKTGKLKLVIVSGIFTQNSESRVDLLVVGDNLRKRTIQNIITNIESDIGKEIRYATFETSDFTYRLSVYDKLIRDIIDYPHERLLEKILVK